MTRAERGLWWTTVATLAVGGAAFAYAARPSLAHVGHALRTYLDHRVPTGPTVLLLVLALLARVGARLLDSGDHGTTRRDDGPVISPVAVVDAEVATAVRDTLNDLATTLRSLTRTEKPDVVDFLDRLLRGAIRVGASDVHMHPVESGTHISFRVHGVLEDIMTFPRAHHVQLVMRLKVLSRLVTYQSDRPQDGHFVLAAGSASADIRVSVLPTNHGEKAVLRIARVGLNVPGLDELGFPAELLERYRRVLAKPQGVVFLTGPTGSGKTTTIYASLSHLKHARGETTQIATIEDPIEFNVPFLTQTQVNNLVDLTFAQGLRSILRQDPNVIMVGEIRDAETAHIAVQAGLTGHQIVTTVHADSAAGVFNRMIEMGVEPFVLASASLACMSQRLVRAVCPHCRQEAAPGADELARLTSLGDTRGPFYRGAGCKRCDHTGHLGRVGIYELLEVTPTIRELMNQKVPTNRIQEQAVSEGMQPLIVSGLARARAGDTTLAEVFRVCI